jgi:putative spermidine/putrescine transport system substrate-binding protein
MPEAGTVSKLVAVALAFTLLSCVGSRASDLVVTSWGGSYETSQRNAYGESFEEMTGARIRWEEYSGGLDQIRSQIESGEVVWDVVDVFAHDARAGCRQGLFETLPEKFYSDAGIDADMLVDRPNDCVGPNILWSWVVAYDSRSFDEDGPETLDDFFDVERFPGKRAISVYPQANLEMALVADGVEPGLVYEVLGTPEGVDRAFRKLSQLADHVTFWSAGEEPVELLREGEVSMATAYSGRIGAAALAGDDWLEPIFDGQVVEEEWLVIPKGAPNGDLARKFLAHVAQPRQQALQARWIPYGPMRRSALDIIASGEPWFHTGRDVLPYLPTTTVRLNRSVISDPDWWADNSTEMTERFAAWRRGLQY